MSRIFLLYRLSTTSAIMAGSSSVFAALILTVHLAFILTAGRFLKLDLIEIVVASNANMGGPTTAAEFPTDAVGLTGRGVLGHDSRGHADGLAVATAEDRVGVRGLGGLLGGQVRVAKKLPLELGGLVAVLGVALRHLVLLTLTTDSGGG